MLKLLEQTSKIFVGLSSPRRDVYLFRSCRIRNTCFHQRVVYCSMVSNTSLALYFISVL